MCLAPAYVSVPVRQQRQEKRQLEISDQYEALILIAMPVNTAGVLALFQVAVRPGLLLPRIIVRDIRELDLEKLKARGITGVVFDKDNCLTKPLHDNVVPELREAWPALVRAFGRKNVLIVSNSAGTRDDAGLLQAESVSRHLGVPVFLHAVKKPGCAKAVRAYFEQDDAAVQHDVKGKGRADPYPTAPIVDVAPPTLRSQLAASLEQTASSRRRRRLLVVGDRVMTDVVLGNRINVLNARSLPRPHSMSSQVDPADNTEEASFEAIPVLTTTVWKMEGLGSRLMRFLEAWSMRQVLRYHRTRRNHDPLPDWQDCTVIGSSDLTTPAAAASASTNSSQSASRAAGLQPSETATRPAPPPIDWQAVWRAPFREQLSLLGGRIRLLALRLLTPMARYAMTKMAEPRQLIRAFVAEAKSQRFGYKRPVGFGRWMIIRRAINGQE